MTHSQQSGFSLIGVLVGLAVAGATTLAVLALARQMNFIAILSDSNAETYNQVYQLRLALSDPQTCSLNFAGTDLTSRQSQIKIPLYRDLANTSVLGIKQIIPGRNVASEVKTYVQSISIEKDDSNPQLAKVVLDFARNGITTPMIRSFPMAVQLDASNKIIACSTGDVVLKTGNDKPVSQNGNCDSVSSAFASIGAKRRTQIQHICNQLSYPTSASNYITFPTSKDAVNFVGDPFQLPAVFTDPLIISLYRPGEAPALNPLTDEPPPPPNRLPVGPIFSNLDSKEACMAIPTFAEGSRIPSSSARHGEYFCINGYWTTRAWSN